MPGENLTLYAKWEQDDGGEDPDNPQTGDDIALCVSLLGLSVVGIAAVITPIKAMEADVLSRDLPIMSSLTLLLFLICFPFFKSKRAKASRKKEERFGFGRIGGALFLSLYVAYLVLLGIQSV